MNKKGCRDYRVPFFISSKFIPGTLKTEVILLSGHPLTVYISTPLMPD